METIYLGEERENVLLSSLLKGKIKIVRNDRPPLSCSINNVFSVPHIYSEYNIFFRSLNYLQAEQQFEQKGLFIFRSGEGRGWRMRH